MTIAATAVGSSASAVYAVIAALAGLFALAAAAGACYGVFSAKKTEKQLELYRDDNEKLDRDNARLTRQVADLTADNDVLRAKVQTLEDLVTAEKAIRDLEGKVDANHAELLKAIRARRSA